MWRRNREPPPVPVLDDATLNGMINMIMRIDANVQFLVEETRKDDGEEED